MDDRLLAAPPDDEPESYGKVIAHLFGLVAGLAVLAFVVLRTPSETPPKPAAVVASAEPEPTVEPVVEPPAAAGTAVEAEAASRAADAGHGGRCAGRGRT